jgi:hypothetical protein
MVSIVPIHEALRLEVMKEQGRNILWTCRLGDILIKFTRNEYMFSNTCTHSPLPSPLLLPFPPLFIKSFIMILTKKFHNYTLATYTPLPRVPINILPYSNLSPATLHGLSPSPLLNFQYLYCQCDLSPSAPSTPSAPSAPSTPSAPSPSTPSAPSPSTPSAPSPHSFRSFRCVLHSQVSRYHPKWNQNH